MAKETRSKRIEILLTPTENTKAEQMALSERVTVSGLIRSRIFKKASIIDDATKLQLVEKTSITLSKLNKYIKDTPKPEEIESVLTEIREELKEAQTLIANLSHQLVRYD